MALVINEEQQMLKASARTFLKKEAPVAALRQLRDSKDEMGYSPELWQTMAEMGWTALTIPEAYGGLGFGYVGLGQVLEETGRTLTASPLISTVLLSSSIINLGGNLVQKEALLPAIAEGGLIVATAFEESNNHRPLQVNARFEKTENGYVLNGVKTFVLDGNVANKLIVTAKSSEESGLSLFVVNANAEGLAIKRKTMMDSRNVASIAFEKVTIDSNGLLGEEGQGGAILEKTLDIARIGLSAEMLGIIQEAFDRTIAYIKQRQQFGVPIGSFQALQHRAAQAYCEIELCKSLVLKALQAIDADSKALPVLASMTKAKVGEVVKLVTNEAIQMHGGIGMTDEEEIGFFLKRARVAQQTFGDYNYHFDRFAHLKGF